MANILNRWIKTGVITIGTDLKKLDTPTFEIINVNIDTVNKIVNVQILHEVSQGSITQKHSRTTTVTFAGLPSEVRASGAFFLSSIEAEILKLPQYSGATNA